jgi:hypothetical protein
VNQLFIFGKVKLGIIDKSEQCGGEFNLNISALYVNESGPGNGLKYRNEVALHLRKGTPIDERGNEMLRIVSPGRNTIRGVRTRGKVFIEHHRTGTLYKKTLYKQYGEKDNRTTSLNAFPGGHIYQPCVEV